MTGPFRASHDAPSRGNHRLGRWVLAFLVVLAGVLGTASTASAHAELSRSSPEDGAVLDSAPGAITITFSESVTVQPSGVRVVDAQGDRVDAGTASATDTVVRSPLRSGVPDGSYLVAWRVVSADGHPVRGAFAFSVGNRTRLDDDLAERVFESDGDRADEIAGAVLRAVAYLGALGAAGFVGIGVALRRADEGPVVSRLAAGAAMVAVVAIVAQLPLQAALATGEGLGSISRPGVLSLVLGDGVWLMLAVTGLGLVAMALCSGLASTPATRRIALSGALVAPLGFAITGHSRTMSPAVVGYLADAAHLLAGAAWFGGLIALVQVVRSRRRAGDDLDAAAAVATYSGWAAVVLGTVVVAGTAMGWIEVGGLQPLVSTTYGQLLIAKVVVVAGIAAVAGWNRFRLLPTIASRVLADGDGDQTFDATGDPRLGSSDRPEVHQGEASTSTAPWSQLVRAMRVEVLGIAVVLGITAVLVNAVPAKVAAGQDLLSLRTELGGGTVELVVDPTGGGRTDVHAYLLDQAGRPDGRYQQATFAFSLPAEDIGPLVRVPIRPSPGHFQVLNLQLAPTGTWALTITVKVDKFTEEEATLSFPIR